MFLLNGWKISKKQIKIPRNVRSDVKLKTVDDAQLDADQVNSDQVDVVQKNAAQVDAAPKEFT